MLRISKLAVFSAIFFMLCGFSVKESSNVPFGQPKSERQAQDELPKSNDPMWNILAKTKISVNKKKGLYSATYPDEIKALVGTEITIGGFILPVEPTEKFKHFILSKRTPTCPFCPPGAPNEIIDIWMEKPISWDEDMIKVTGTFELMNNPELGMFFKITKAKKIK